MSWLGNNEPLLDVPGPFRVVLPGSLTIPEVSICHNAVRTHAFRYDSVRLNIFNLEVIDCHCRGDLCSGLDQYKDGNILTTCACFTSMKRTAGITLLLSLGLVMAGDGGEVKLDVFDFTSRDFTLKFVSGGVPAGITASMITENDDFVRTFLDNVVTAVDVVNRNGGFSVSGWVRKGYSMDQGLSASKEGAEKGGASHKVKSSEFSIHLTHVEFDERLISDYLTDLFVALRRNNGVVAKVSSPPAAVV